MSARPRATRVAHAYGNSRQSLARALNTDIDMIEVDVWFEGRNFRIGHERRVGRLPLLYDSVIVGHAPGPFAIRLGGHFVRPDIRPFQLTDLLRIVAGRKHLLLDVKGHHNFQNARHFASVLIRCIDEGNASAWVTVCGQTYSVLDALREQTAPFPIRYSMERPHQWDGFVDRMREDDSVRAVCIQHKLLSEQRLGSARDAEVNLFCWTVDDPAVATRLIDSGVHGIISNDLALLAALA